MAVRLRVPRVTHPRQRTARRPNDGIDKRSLSVIAVMVTRNLNALALKGDFRVRERQRLHPGHRLRSGETRRNHSEHATGQERAAAQWPHADIGYEDLVAGMGVSCFSVGRSPG